MINAHARECCYKVLRVTRNSSDKEIKDSFIKLAKLYHPDINQGDDSADKFRRIHEAYTSLKDATARREYDRMRAVEESHTSQPFHASSGDWPQQKRSHHHYNPVDVPVHNESSNSIGLIIGVSFSIFLALMLMWPSSDQQSPSSHSTSSNSPSRGQSALVDAWWNPSSRRWEAPAPWDPEFIKHKHSMKKVDRHLVFRRKNV